MSLSAVHSTQAEVDRFWLDQMIAGDYGKQLWIKVTPSQNSLLYIAHNLLVSPHTKTEFSDFNEAWEFYLKIGSDASGNLKDRL